MDSKWPLVSVVMPVRDEAADLRAAVAGVLAQEYPGAVEVVLAVGPSGDGTEAVADALAAEDPRVRVVANPAGATPAALNAGIRAARGEIVARIDGHAVPLPGYLRRAVEVLAETGAANVGGVQQAEGTTPFERAVAAAMTSRFGTGDAKFHYGGAPGPTDTVYLGVFRRAWLDRVGGFDEHLVRNQDYELNVRLRAAGGTVWFDPGLRVRYRPRGTLRGLARQYGEYGRWKRAVLRRHPRSLRWRQAVPPAALLGVVGGLLVGCTRRGRPALALPAAYAAGLAVATRLAGRDLAPAERRLLPLVFATIHGAWGAGFLAGPPRDSPERRIDTVVFDLGGVLIDWNPRHLYRGAFANEAAMEEFLGSVTTAAWNLELDRGRPFVEAVRELAAEHPQHEALIRAYHERWPEMLRDPIAGTVEILAELRAAGVRCYALTNWSAETFPYARERYNFLATFDGVVVSGEERAVKPEPALFAVLEERFGVEPHRSVFIDDSASNVHAAAARGYATVHFVGPEHLRARLADLGLPVRRNPGAVPRQLDVARPRRPLG